jgi:hypothetical protein
MVPQINALIIMILFLGKEKCDLFQTPWLVNLVWSLEVCSEGKAHPTTALPCSGI